MLYREALHDSGRNAFPPETHAVSFFVLGINERMQLQFRRREELFLKQLQLLMQLQCFNF